MRKFVTYLTMYLGDKLPKWYIGSTYEEKIINGYNGSVRSKKYKEIYDKEQKINKHLFRSRILSYHETDEEARAEELRLQLMHNVVVNDNYFNESYAKENGYFGMVVNGVQHPRFGSNHNEETKSKMKKIKKELFKNGELTHYGQNNPMYGKIAITKDNDYIYINQEELEDYLKQGFIKKGKPKSDGMKQKLSETLTGRELTLKQKNKISKSMQGKKNNLGNTHSDETKELISKKSSGRIWIINKKTKKTKFINPDDLSEYSVDWLIGRKI